VVHHRHDWGDRHHKVAVFSPSTLSFGLPFISSSTPHERDSGGGEGSEGELIAGNVWSGQGNGRAMGEPKEVLWWDRPNCLGCEGLQRSVVSRYKRSGRQRRALAY
ncbi:hypothetical protein H0E87_031455, partial [Populus deltoides]